MIRVAERVRKNPQPDFIEPASMQKQFTIAADPKSCHAFESTRLSDARVYDAVGNDAPGCDFDATFGQIDWIAETGEVKKSWQIECESVTIGSNNGCSIVIPSMGLEAFHGSVSFGRNHILVQAIEGSIKISGRQIREWLIDEPTYIFFGAAKIQVTPASFLKKQFASHRLTPGDVSDQAARIQALANGSSLEVDVSHRDSDLAMNSSSPTMPPPTTLNAPSPASLNAAEVAYEMKAVFGPLQISLEAIRSSVVDGLRDLSTNLTERYEQRFQDTSAVIDSRFERLEGLLVSSQSSSGRDAAKNDEFKYDEPRYDEPRYDEPRYDELRYAEPKFDQPQYASPEYAPAEHEEPIAAVDAQNHNTYQSFEAIPTVDVHQSPEYVASLDIPVLQTTTSLSDEEFFGVHALDASIADAFIADAFTSDTSKGEDATNQYPRADFSESYESQNEMVGNEHATYHDSRFETSDFDPVESSASQNEHEASVSTVVNREMDLEMPAWFTAPTADPSQSDDMYVDSTAENLDGNRDKSFVENFAQHIAEEGFSHSAADTFGESRKIYESALLEELSYPESSETDLDSDSNPNSNDLGYYSPSLSVTPFAANEETTHQEIDDSHVSSHEEFLDSHESLPIQEFSEALGGEEEESIEVYMQRLLKRAKGSTDSSTSIRPSSVDVGKEKSVASKEKSVVQNQAARSTDPIDPTRLSQARPVTNDFESDLGAERKLYGAMPKATEDQPMLARTTPRVSVEDQQQSLIALRELANHTARKAITLNTQKRMEGHFYGKLVISASGFVGGTIVLAINGLTPNVAMAGMICAYAVFVLWGYDAWNHSRRLVASKKEDEVENE